MREILFRGKRICNGEWVYGNLILTERLTETECYISSQTGIDNGKSYKFYVDPLTVGQFTGLTDKNGKKVFEGDIVDITQYDNIYHEVHRCCKSKVFFSNFAFRTNAAPEYEDEEPLSYWFWHDCDFEIVGNIHDNPELLEVTE